jgi:hypothetical protein
VCMTEETTKWNVHNLEWVSVLRLQWYFNEKIAAYLGKRVRVKPVPVRFKTLFPRSNLLIHAGCQDAILYPHIM